MFGWTLDEPGAFDLLDLFVAAGGNFIFIDTAEDYSVWVPDNSGGESETILGRCMAERLHRDHVVIATKVSTSPRREPPTSQAIRAAVEGSLRRLQITSTCTTRTATTCTRLLGDAVGVRPARA